jgi:nucleotide-binding universal stress UspA family protein
VDELKKLLPDEASTLCNPEFAVDAGDAGEQIVRFARDEQADVIVMGLPAVAESAAQMRASVTYRVISSAVCPVLTIPDRVAVDF